MHGDGAERGDLPSVGFSNPSGGKSTLQRPGEAGDGDLHGAVLDGDGGDGAEHAAESGGAGPVSEHAHERQLDDGDAGILDVEVRELGQREFEQEREEHPHHAAVANGNAPSLSSCPFAPAPGHVTYEDCSALACQVIGPLLPTTWNETASFPVGPGSASSRTGSLYTASPAAIVVPPILGRRGPLGGPGEAPADEADLGVLEQAALVGTLILTIVVLIFAEVAPKTIGALNPARIALPAALVYYPLLKITYPAVWVLNLFANGLLRLLGVRPNEMTSHSLSAEELRTVVAEAGVMVPRRHREMLLSILDLDAITVDDIMVPRSEIIGIDIEHDWERIQQWLIDFIQDHWLKAASALAAMIGTSLWAFFWAWRSWRNRSPGTGPARCGVCETGTA